MSPRLQLVSFQDSPALIEVASSALSELTDGEWKVQKVLTEHATIYETLEHAFRVGARSVVIQRRVLDPDYMAEFTAYYSRRFVNYNRYCTRLHFFKSRAAGTDDPLAFLDAQKENSYLGFLTLRPVGRTPVGATMLIQPAVKHGNIRCLDDFPVHLGGVKFHITATPFMQQDNAVGACAQASIWMALRTMRKREGDRAFDPAQISGEATRYSTLARILPNREGLTDDQMLDAVRGTGYSPHLFPLTMDSSDARRAAEQIQRAKQQIGVYLDSEVPVLLTLETEEQGHAMVAVGYTFLSRPATAPPDSVSVSETAVPITHTAIWTGNLIVHNDNSGPYLHLEDRSNSAEPGYALDQVVSAIPLLPVDVFLTGEEALEVALAAWDSVLSGLTKKMTKPERIAFGGRFALRLLLLDRRRVRAWAKDSKAPQALAREMRLADLYRRVWALEIHLKSEVGKHAASAASSMVGFILIDPTGDVHRNSVLMTYINLRKINGGAAGSLFVKPRKFVKIPGHGFLPPFRTIHGHAHVFHV